jgi:hypothetical protein
MRVVHLEDAYQKLGFFNFKILKLKIRICDGDADGAWDEVFLIA